MAYTPQPPPFDVKQLPSYLDLELQRISRDLADNASTVFYVTDPVTSASLSISNGSSANWKVAGNVLLVSCSTTQTFTGFQRGLMDATRVFFFVQVGAGVAVLKSEASESSASNRMALVSSISLSQNGSLMLWRDPIAARWRGLAKL